MLGLRELLLKLIESTEQRTLLWTNANPDTAFIASDVSLPNVYDYYDFIEVVYLSRTDESSDTGMKVTERTPCHAQTVATIVAYASSSWYLRHRARWWNVSHTGIHFDSGYYNNLVTPSTNGQNDAVLVPLKIYGIKLAS